MTPIMHAAMRPLRSYWTMGLSGRHWPIYYLACRTIKIIRSFLRLDTYVKGSMGSKQSSCYAISHHPASHQLLSVMQQQKNEVNVWAGLVQSAFALWFSWFASEIPLALGGKVARIHSSAQAGWNIELEYSQVQDRNYCSDEMTGAVALTSRAQPGHQYPAFPLLRQ